MTKIMHYPSATDHEVQVSLGFDGVEVKIFPDEDHVAPAILWADITQDYRNGWSIVRVFLGSAFPSGESEELSGKIAEDAKAILLADEEFIRWADAKVKSWAETLCLENRAA